MGQCAAQPLPGYCCKGKDDAVPTITPGEAEAIQAGAMVDGPESHDHERLSLWCCKLMQLAHGEAAILSEVPLSDALEALAASSTHVTPAGQLADKRVGVHFANARLDAKIRRWVTQEAFVNAIRPLVQSGPEHEAQEGKENGQTISYNDDISLMLFDIFKILDTDRRGSIALGECSCAAALFFGGSAAEQDKALFKILDADSSGALSKQEFGLYICPLVRVAILPGDLGRQEVLEELVQRVFKGVRLNSNGEMSFEEWETWVQTADLAKEVEQAAHTIHRNVQIKKGVSGELQ